MDTIDSNQIPKTPTQQKLFLALEILAISLGLTYTILYIQEVRYCFVFALLGALIYAYLCFEKKIFAESLLQVFYVLTAVYGWFNWGRFNENSFSLTTHVVTLVLTAVATYAIGRFLKNKTKSKLPYLDSFTSVFSLTGTWLMVNFVHETWLYFIAINFVSMFLYYQRGMKLSVFLYAFYVYLSLAGWFHWNLFF